MFCMELSVFFHLSDPRTVQQHAEEKPALCPLLVSESIQTAWFNLWFTVTCSWAAARGTWPAVCRYTVIVKRRSAGGVQLSGKILQNTFLTRLARSAESKHSLTILLRKSANTSHVHSHVSLWHFLEESNVFVGSGGSSRPRVQGEGKCMK